MQNNITKTMRISIVPKSSFPPLEKNKKNLSIIGDDKELLSQDTRMTNNNVDTSTYEKLLQSIYDAVLITNTSGDIIDFNFRALDLFKCKSDWFSNKTILSLISGADSSLLDKVRKNLGERRYTLVEAQCLRSDGKKIPTEIAINKINLTGESQICFFIRDVSVRKRAQKALEEAIMRLEEHDERRSQFVSNVSHELRTPLTSMTYAVANILRGVAGPISDRIKRYLEILQGDCKRLSGTVNDILDIRKAETNTLTITKSRVPFCRLVSKTVESFTVQTEQKSIDINLSMEEDSCFVNCDYHKMVRVLLNIIGNAIKFTPSGGNINISLKNNPDRSGYLRFAVRDTGIGIPPDAIDKVTQRYFTVGEQPSGSGLGLAISKEIIDIHDGKLQIKSPPDDYDSGTIVFIDLPLVNPPTVLIVDDNAQVLDILEAQIARHGYKVIRAENGNEVLKKVEEFNVNIVILDLLLPGIEGTEVILKMKASKTARKIPIIVITGGHVGKDKAQLLRNFAIPALSKPWHEEELLDRVEGAFIGFAALS